MNIASLEYIAAQMGQISKLVRLLATSGITSEHFQRAIDNKSARANLVEFLQAECPKIDYTQPMPKAKRAKKGATQPFDEAVFFQTRSGLWVDSDLERYVGLEKRTRRDSSVRKRRLLSQNENEVTMFGQLGSDQHTETLANAVDLGQIAELIAVQATGKSGPLLNNGYANIFPVRGKDGALRVVNVYWSAGDREWFVGCRPFLPDVVWSAGDQVFSN